MFEGVKGERNDPEANQLGATDMLFILLLHLEGDYNKSYSSCAWHLCGEIDECLIVYLGVYDDL